MAAFISNPSEVTNDILQKYGWWLKHQPNDEIIEKLEIILQFLPKARKEFILKKLLEEKM